jgi:GNAT superfamily N-acetyltransferase
MAVHGSDLEIRTAKTADAATIFDLILSLAAYEHLTHAVQGSVCQLERHLFGDRPYAEVLLAEVEGRAVGLALFYTTYSTFATCPGLFLEDLFVVPEYRRRGIGRALVQRVARLALERDFSRVEWSVLDWNETAIGFYRRIGARVLVDWRLCRLCGDDLSLLSGRPSGGTD